MRDRIVALLGPGAAKDGDPAYQAPAWMGTFHSIMGRILRRDAHLIGVDRSYVIYDEADRLAAMKRAMQKLALDEKRFPPSAIVQRISHAKNEMLGPEEYAAQAEDYFSEVVSRVYPLYEEAMRGASALDFDDMLLMTVRLFREAEGALEKWQNRFRHVLVDEYQDTNRVQYTLVQLLGEKHRNLCVVGDDDQSIYRFRGADVRNILSFERDFPEAQGRQAGAELPLYAAHPRRGPQRHQGGPRPRREEALDRRRRRARRSSWRRSTTSRRRPSRWPPRCVA